MSDFRERLRRLRREAHVPERELAQLLNITAEAYIKYETGKREPCMERLILLAQRFGVSADYLAGRTEEPTPYPGSKYPEKSLFPERLRVLRKAKKLYQRQLAADVGLVERAVGRYEMGERRPRLDRLIVIADYFDASIDYLLGIKDTPERR